jgi:hypothetical protein
MYEALGSEIENLENRRQRTRTILKKNLPDSEPNGPVSEPSSLESSEEQNRKIEELKNRRQQTRTNLENDGLDDEDDEEEISVEGVSAETSTAGSGRGQSRATLRDRYGSLSMHLVVAILTFWWTFGIGNGVYAVYRQYQWGQREQQGGKETA